MSVEIAWKQNILVTDFHLLKSLLVVFGFGSQAFICGFSRQNINSVDMTGIILIQTESYFYPGSRHYFQFDDPLMSIKKSSLTPKI
jgi:hypothetical protein